MYELKLFGVRLIICCNIRHGDNIGLIMHDVVLQLGQAVHLVAIEPVDAASAKHLDQNWTTTTRLVRLGDQTRPFLRDETTAYTVEERLLAGGDVAGSLLDENLARRQDTRLAKAKNETKSVNDCSSTPIGQAVDLDLHGVPLEPVEPMLGKRGVDVLVDIDDVPRT